jgi:anti-sigma regulatory factor (Ser/Thr protein kinase)
MEAVMERASDEAFRHEAYFYSGIAEFREGLGGFIREGLDNDEPALVVLTADKIELLRDDLGPDADRVLFADMDEVGANPARIIPAWREFVAGHEGVSGRVRGIGEPISAERSPAALVECQHHESLLNVAFADTPGFYLLCPYDVGALGPHVLLEARRSHPFVVVNGEERTNPDFRDFHDGTPLLCETLPSPTAQPRWRVFGLRGLAGLREFVAAEASDAGLEKRGSDLVMAANEIATNSVRYGGGGGNVRVWEDGASLICEINDKGKIDEPLVGRRTPVEGQVSGYGVWLANQLVDLVQVRNTPVGTTVRLHVLLPA